MLVASPKLTELSGERTVGELVVSFSKGSLLMLVKVVSYFSLNRLDSLV